MNKCLTSWIAFGVVALVTTCEARLANAQAARERKPVVWVNPRLPNGPGMEHKVLASEALGHDVGYVVWTPTDYDSSGATRYPSIYFLHGRGGNESADAGGFSSLVARSIEAGVIPSCICIFPNGGRNGYRDKVEAMIIDELVPLIDRTYRTKSEGASRAVAGFSMGGAGAVYLSIQHPNLFCAAGSWGGGMFRGAEQLLSAAKKHGDTLRKNDFRFLLINGENDRPDAFASLAETLLPRQVPCHIVTLQDTDHNLGLYYERGGQRMAEFLGASLGVDR